jgi:hypothetical protein
LLDFDYRVDVVGRIAAGGNLADVHDEIAFSITPRFSAGASFFQLGLSPL